MGTVVFPEAAYKILTTDPETRAKEVSRVAEKGQEVNMRDLIKDIEARDKADGKIIVTLNSCIRCINN